MFRRAFERLHEPLAPPLTFLLRLARNALIAAGLVTGALAIGVLGYHYLEQRAWIDALLEAAMLLGGMGPIAAPVTTAGKLFAAFYALFSGIVFLTMAAVLAAPVFHRLLHLFHLKSSANKGPAP